MTRLWSEGRSLLPATSEGWEKGTLGSLGLVCGQDGRVCQYDSMMFAYLIVALFSTHLQRLLMRIVLVILQVLVLK